MEPRTGESVPRFSIRQLLTATALVALGCLALLKSSTLLASGMLGGVALSLVAAIVLAIYRSADSRAFWVGFAIFGWSYLLFCYGPIFTNNNGPFGWRFVTARLATALYDRIHESNGVQPTAAYTTAVADPFGAPPTPPTAVFAPMPMPMPGQDRGNFLNVAHSLWTLMIAWGGGWFALWARRGSTKS
jgi:hypothetical protein